MIEVALLVALGAYAMGGIALLVWHAIDAVVAAVVEDNRALSISLVGMIAAPFWPITLPAWVLYDRRRGESA